MRLPASPGDFQAEPRKEPQSKTLFSENGATEAPIDVFNASKTSISAPAEVKKKKSSFKKNESLDSSRLVPSNENLEGHKILG